MSNRPERGLTHSPKTFLCGAGSVLLYKCKHSVLFEFNRTSEDDLKPISVGTFHNRLKQHCPYVGIRPSMSDYCDKCKEFEEEISRCQQIVNRLVQSGHATESEYMHAFLTLIHGDMHNMFTYRTYITSHLSIHTTYTHHAFFMYVQLLLQSSILINLTYLLLQRRLLNRSQECLSSEKITKNIKTMLRMLSSTIYKKKNCFN